MRPVWADDEWLQKYSGKANEQQQAEQAANEAAVAGGKRTSENTVSTLLHYSLVFLYICKLCM